MKHFTRPSGQWKPGGWGKSGDQPFQKEDLAALKMMGGVVAVGVVVVVGFVFSALFCCLCPFRVRRKPLVPHGVPS